MSLKRLWILPILFGLFVGFSANAANKVMPPIDLVDAKNIILVDEIKPGMKGYGKTVFRGTKIETFQVEVLGIMKKVNFGTDLILVKMTGGPITARGANLIQGMSGSPIYLNGKIAGALAYGEAFGKEPIAMVTPIQYMLEAWDPKLPSKPSSFFPFSTTGLQRPITLNGKSYSKISIDYAGTQLAPEPGVLYMRPLATHILVSSMSPRIMAWLSESLKPLNVIPIAGPGRAVDKANLDIDIQPGAAVGVSFVTGDLDATGIGTVTYRRGNKIVAFGHPMFSDGLMNGIGPMAAPLTTAYVYDIFPSIMVSSKIAAPVKTIGCVFQDRPWAIAGEIGRKAETIPVIVHVTDKATDRKRDFRVEVINHPLLAMNFIVAATAEAIFELRGSPGDATANVKVQVTAEELGTITRENVFFDPVSIDMESVNELIQILSMLRFNPFYPVAVQKVEVWADITPKHPTAKIDRVFLKEAKYKPGDTVEIGVVLKPFKGEKQTKTIKLELPKNMQSGNYQIQIRGGASSGVAMVVSEEGVQESLIIGGQSVISPSRPAFENLQQMVRKFLEREKNNELVAKITLPKLVPSIGGEKLSGLPPSIADAMRSSKSSALATERDEVKTVVSTDWIIQGMQMLSISVQKVEKSEKKSTSPKGPESAQPPSSQGGEEEQDEGSAPGRSEGKPSETDYSEFGIPSYGDIQTRVLSSTTEPPAKSEPQKTDKQTEMLGSKTESPKGTTSPTTSTASTEEKPVGRAASVWKQTTRSDFMLGTFVNTAATSGDLLLLASSIKPFFESSETFVWSLLPDGNGNIFAGTGNNGIIYKVAADGTASVYYDSDELAIHSLALDSAGNVYAGTSPNGKVLKIAPDGKATALFDADEKYISALSLDSKGNIYAATGDKCKVYRISPDSKVEVLLDTSEFHALSLAVDRNDNVYVGTGLNGIIYKITPAGRVSVFYDAAEESVTALAVNESGVVFAGTSPKGVIYKLAPDAPSRVLYDKAGTGIYGIVAEASGNVYALNASNVFKIFPDETVCTLNNEHDVQFLSLAVSNGTLFAGTGNIGSIYRADVGKTTEGTYESPVHDCGQASSWGVITWTAETPKGSSVTLRTRTGWVAEPDSTWSEWSSPYLSSGSKIASPPGRYIQYIATLATEDASISPKLRDVEIVFLPKNQSPKVTFVSPKGGEKWSKKKTIKWTGADPDNDTLTYELFCSTDNGATWQKLSDKVKSSPETTNNSPREQSSEKKELNRKATAPISIKNDDPEKMIAEMAAELEKHPEIPQDVKDKIMEQAPSIIAEGSRQAKENADSREEDSKAEVKTDTSSTKQTSFTWDTSKYPDGTYLIKIVASDRTSNPIDPLTVEAISEPFIVTNKAPKVYAFKKTLTILADRSVRVEGVTFHDVVGVAGVQFKVDSGDWMAAAASDGIFDTQFETFVVVTQPLDKGKHTVEIKSIDQAGNAASTKLEVEIN
ncbi:MAG: SpoIVB peptidase S55 domain-containing protein [Armatimonadota bacterium]|nr:SpoIVB peptidase S55 domain-containing protein [Armatimonadota bacterium]